MAAAQLPEIAEGKRNDFNLALWRNGRDVLRQDDFRYLVTPASSTLGQLKNAFTGQLCMGRIVLTSGALLLGGVLCLAEESGAGSAAVYAQKLRPLLAQYCYDCHNTQTTEGDLDLSALATAEDLAADPARLESMLQVVSERFMPPPRAKQQPSLEQRVQLTDWIQAKLQRIGQAQAGDPGRVVLRRLTNAEMNYTLDDLTGIRRDWTRDFPRDASGGEGFTGVGTTLQMSASQIEKYLALAQEVVDAALMLPGSGPVFLKTPTGKMSPLERARRTLLRLDDFGRQQHLVYQDLTPAAQVASYAYPDAKQRALTDITAMPGYKPHSSEVPGAVFSFVGSTFRLFYRTEKLNPTPLSYMIHRGRLTQPGGEPISAEQQQTWDRLWLDFRHASGFARPAKISLLHRWFSHQPYRRGDEVAFEQAMSHWKVGDGTSPDGYKRHRLDPQTDLSFSVMTLAHHLRDLRALTPQALQVYTNIQRSGDGESRTLMVPNHDAFDAFLQRSFDDEQLAIIWARVCDPNSDLARRIGAVPPSEMQAAWREWTERDREWRRQSVTAASQAISRFAALAWRRPLTAAEQQALTRRLVAGLTEGQALQEAAEVPLLTILMSPHFLYRLEASRQQPDEPAVRPLTDHELATRLSYFLWSSLPDEQLLAAAQRGELSDPQGLATHARRLTQDPRIRRFAHEMFGQWLGFYRFEEYDRVSGQRFPEFKTHLRRDMAHEAVDFCTDLVASDRDIRLLISADYSFLTRPLAAHYGVARTPERDDLWSQAVPPESLIKAPRISLGDTPRRGLLGWGALLTATSHPLRTSPILRGNWILDDLLGIPTPPPPAAVPELPADEQNSAGLRVAQLLARHREDSACSVCHDRIDPLGLPLEQFDPIGRLREFDLNGQAIQAQSTLPDGTTLQGAMGLAEYLQQEERQALFVRRFCRKALGYALSREVLPGDTQLLDEMVANLQRDGHRFSIVLESIVQSSQFRNLRRK